MHGPAILEYLSDTNSTDASTGVLTDGDYTTATESDAASDVASDTTSEAGDERATSDFDVHSSSELGSFSDLSAPFGFHLYGTPRSGSPSLSAALGGTTSSDDWSDVGGDTDGEVLSPPSSGAATPARANSPARVEPSVDVKDDGPGHVQTPASPLSLWPTSKWPTESKLKVQLGQHSKQTNPNPLHAKPADPVEESQQGAGVPK
jgi:hypothetical protein